MSTVDQAIGYCKEKAKHENAVLYDRCRKILMMNNLPQWTEQEKWSRALEEAELDTYPMLCQIMGMRLV